MIAAQADEKAADHVVPPRPWPVTACLLSLDEAKNLGAYFERLKPLVREIVVVDSGSADGSLDIAMRHADVVVRHDLESFAAQRNLASSKATNRWVLHLDADEVLTPELILAVDSMISSNTLDENAAYCFPRKTFDEKGRLRKIVQSYPGFHYRLYDRERCRWVKPVHETLAIEGSKKFIPHHILHYPDYSKVPAKLDLYTKLKDDRSNGDRPPATAASVLENFRFHARSLFVDLGMWKRPSDFLFACHWLLHQGWVRIRRVI